MQGRNPDTRLLPLELVKLDRLMERTSGRFQVAIGLIDGPVAMDHPDLSGANIRDVPGQRTGLCLLASSIACTHGTFVAGILLAKRGSLAPAICPGCSLLVRPIFPEACAVTDMPSATPTELATAIVETVEAGAHIINLSAVLLQLAPQSEHKLAQALDFAAARGVITVVAAGNQGTIGSSAITRHPWVIPVAGCDRSGWPLGESNFGASIGRRGLSAPAENITSLGTNGKSRNFSGTSAAAPFVTGAIALLWSEFPSASAAEVKLAITARRQHWRDGIVPPLLNAWAAYRAMALEQGRNTS